MGLIGNILEAIRGERATDLAFISDLTIPVLPSEEINPDECYIEIYIESIRLENARKLATLFHGIVYLFVTLPRIGEKSANIAALSKPEKLAELDQNSLGKVIVLSKKIMGSVPWRGGNLDLELGLFSVKKGNLLTPVLDFVAEVSSAAGYSFVGRARPFLPIIAKGLDLIAGQSQDTALEVAIDTSLPLAKSGVFAIVAAPKAELSGKKISVDPQDHKLLCDGRPLEKAYCVFSIRRSQQKADFGEIAELKERYTALQEAIRSNDIKRAKDELTSFRLTAITSPDLIPADARRLIDKVSQYAETAFPAGLIAKKTSAIEETPFSALDIYND